MFFDVSQCFTMYHNVLQVFHDVLLCFMMFSKLRNDRHRRPPSASGIGDNSAEIGDDGAGIVIATKVSTC